MSLWGTIKIPETTFEEFVGISGQTVGGSGVVIVVRSAEGSLLVGELRWAKNTPNPASLPFGGGVRQPSPDSAYSVV